VAQSFSRTVVKIRREPIRLQVAASLFATMKSHVEDTHRGEEAGFLVCGHSSTEETRVLLGREWHPVPEHAVQERNGPNSVLAWDASFNAKMLSRADSLRASLVLVHAHVSSRRPRFSYDDWRNADRFFPSASRMLDGTVCGMVVMGEDSANGVFWLDGREWGKFDRLRVVDFPLLDLEASFQRRRSNLRVRLDRQTRAIGPDSETSLESATVAVVGVSGGGSHVCQQLAHQGIGRLIVIDDQLVEEVQLGRMVGATPTDVRRSFKTSVMRRLVNSIDPEIRVEEVRARVPTRSTLLALKRADLVVAAVDTFAARDQINAFCRRHLLPLIDIGMNVRSDGERLQSAHGQLVVVTPDSPCLRCTPLLSDEVLRREREARPPGYDFTDDAPGEPQVVSMNGALASEASNAVLDLVTGYANGARGAGWWLYDGRAGTMTRATLPPRAAGCPACAELGHGDPLVA
jgi:molybdopterin-synthase adenylyltransferase